MPAASVERRWTQRCGPSRQGGKGDGGRLCKRGHGMAAKYVDSADIPARTVEANLRCGQGHGGRGAGSTAVEEVTRRPWRSSSPWPRPRRTPVGESLSWLWLRERLWETLLRTNCGGDRAAAADEATKQPHGRGRAETVGRDVAAGVACRRGRDEQGLSSRTRLLQHGRGRCCLCRSGYTGRRDGRARISLRSRPQRGEGKQEAAVADDDMGQLRRTPTWSPMETVLFFCHPAF